MNVLTVKRLVALAACVLPMTSFAASAFSGCTQEFFDGFVPQPTAKQPAHAYALCYADFAVLYSGDSKTPIYSAEHLTRDGLQAAREEARTNIFYEEARLPEAARAKLDDYKHSGFDRGHQAPAADRENDEAMAESFSLANMVPQAPENNRGVWARRVESATRKYALRSDSGVYVVTGPIYTHAPTTIGADRVWVPDLLFKLVYDPARRRAWAYILPNTNTARVTGVYSYDDLVSLTWIAFLHPGAL